MDSQREIMQKLRESRESRDAEYTTSEYEEYIQEADNSALLGATAKSVLNNYKKIKSHVEKLESGYGYYAQYSLSEDPAVSEKIRVNKEISRIQSEVFSKLQAIEKLRKV